MADRVEVQASVSKWLLDRRIIQRRTDTVSPTDVVNHMHRYQSAIDRQILADLKILEGCTIRSDPPQYLLLSPGLDKDSESGYSLSITEEQDDGLSSKAYGCQWIIIYGGNTYRLRLFAIVNTHSRLGGVEVQAGIVDEESQPELIVQMRSSAEIQTAIVDIQFVLLSWILRIQQETPVDTEHTNASFG